MPRFSKDQRKTKGLAPGSLVFIGDKKMEQYHISLLDYDKDKLKEEQLSDISSLKDLKSAPSVSWINIYGIHDPEIVASLGEIFDIQSLFLEDILDTHQRPRFYEGDSYLGFILKLIHYDAKSSKIEADQISIIFGENYVLTLQEQKANFFEPIRERIRTTKGKVRTSGTDYLVYLLLDTIIDDYLDVIALIGEEIENLGRSVLTHPNKKMSEEFYNFKIEINFLRKNIRPVKEMLLLWLKSDTILVNKMTKANLKDLSDLVTQAEESIEIYNNLLVDGLNIYNTQINNKANEIMKVLTVFASLFIPLTFLAGVYGMNFKYIPELGFKYSYPIFWGIVLLISGSLLLYFKKRKWM